MNRGMLYVNPPSGLDQRGGGGQYFSKSPPNPLSTEDGGNGYPSYVQSQAMHVTSNGSPPMSPGYNPYQGQSFEYNTMGRSSPDPSGMMAGGQQQAPSSGGGFSYGNMADGGRHHIRHAVSENYLDSSFHGNPAAFGYNMGGDSSQQYSYSPQQPPQSRQQRGPLTRSRSLKERPKKPAVNPMKQRRLSLELIPEDLIAAGVIPAAAALTHNISDLHLDRSASNCNTPASAPSVQGEFTFSPPPVTMTQHGFENYISAANQGHSPQLSRRTQEIAVTHGGGHSPHNNNYMLPPISGGNRSQTSSPQSQRHMINAQMSPLPRIGSYSQFSSQMHQLSSQPPSEEMPDGRGRLREETAQHSRGSSGGGARVETRLVSWGIAEESDDSDRHQQHQVSENSLGSHSDIVMKKM